MSRNCLIGIMNKCHCHCVEKGNTNHRECEISCEHVFIIHKYIDNKLQVFDDRFVITNPRNKEDEGWLTGVLPPEVKQFIKEALEQQREEIFKEVEDLLPYGVNFTDRFYKLKSEQDMSSNDSQLSTKLSSKEPEEKVKEIL